MFTCFNTIQERDGKTDGQTPHDGIVRSMHSNAWQKPVNGEVARFTSHAPDLTHNR